MHSRISLLLVFTLVSVELFSQFIYHPDITNSFYAAYGLNKSDIDLDGDEDILVASNGATYLLENINDTIFGSKSLISELSGANFILDDLNNDQFPDIIMSSYELDKLFYCQNLGNGQFSSEIPVNNSVAGSNIFLVDLNGDGEKDLISSITGQNILTISERSGSSFNSIHQHTLPIPPNSIAIASIADIDLDGFPDLIIIDRHEDKIYWLENLGGFNFANLQLIDSTYAGFTSVSLKDLDNDNDPDLLVSSNITEETYVYENTSGVFIMVDTLANSEDNPLSITYVDFNSDQLTDVIIGYGGTPSTFAYYENLGNLDFAQANNIQGPNFNLAISSVLDFDYLSDGDVDLLIFNRKLGTHTLSVLSNNGANTFDTTIAIADSANYIRQVEGADLTGDGNNEIISFLTGDNRLFTYKNQGVNDFERYISGLESISIENGFECGDIDSDGDLDVLGHGQNSFWWAENDGVGNFVWHYINPFMNLTHMELCDLNGDGKLDIVANGSSQNIFWYENLGGGSFSAFNTIVTINNANSFVCEDFDGDLDYDIAICGNGGVFGLLENLGGSFGPQVQVPSSLNACQRMTSADLNNDGKEDILMVNNFDTLVYFENSGSLTFSAQQSIYISDNGIQTYTSGDVDADGDIDILFYESDPVVIQQKNYFLLHNDGSAQIQSKSLLTNSIEGCYGMSIDDLTGNGVNDIVIGDVLDRLVWYENISSTNSYEISGTTYYDVNQNGIFDGGDFGLPVANIFITPYSTLHSTDTIGEFEVALANGINLIQPVYVSSDWLLSSDSSSYSVDADTLSSNITGYDFGFYPDTLFPSNAIDFTGGFPRCNDTINYWVSFSNSGTVYTETIIAIDLHDSLDVYSLSITADSINGNTYYFSFDSLALFETESINFEVVLPPVSSMVTEVTSFVSVISIDTAGQVSTSIDSLYQVIVCAYDPNDKQVNPVGLGVQGYIAADQELEYLIRFQNTGTDTALNVTIIDELSDLLDYSSFDYVASSHPNSFSISNTGRVQFDFNGINLPDSNVDFNGSQGFVKFKIKPILGVVPEQMISNTADIYFDFNAPIQTNTIYNTIYNCNEVDVSLVVDSVCFNDTVFSICGEEDFNQFDVMSNGIFNSNSKEIEWIADSIGIIQIMYQVSNSICQKDTILYVQVLGAFNYTQDTTICQGDSIYLGGQYRSLSGVYTDTIQSLQSCDSIIYTTLTIYQIDLTVQNNDPFLIATSTGNYQWLNCSNYSIIPSETNQSFTATMNGDYAVQITENGCVDTSNCQTISTVGIDQNEAGEISIYPNPNSGTFSIVSSHFIINEIRIFNSLGELVFTNLNVNDSDYKLNLEVEPGVYVIEIKSKNRIIHKRIVIN